MLKTFALLPLAGVLVISGIASSAAQPLCGNAGRKIEEAAALRYQARQEAKLGNRDRVCDILDEAGDRYDDARDGFEDCGRGALAIDLRSQLRAVRLLKENFRCG